MNEKSIKRYSLSRQVADKLESLIEEGYYAIGSKIPTETELVERFEVSRNTVREAVQYLVSAGILKVKQGDGTYVLSNNRFDANMKMKYESADRNDVQEARNALELTIAHLAAKRRTNEDIEKISLAYQNRLSIKDSIKENTQADVKFHMAIAEACHNEIIIDLYKSIFSFMSENIAEALENQVEEETSEEYHKELFEAIKDGDSIKATNSVHNILNI